MVSEVSKAEASSHFDLVQVALAEARRAYEMAGRALQRAEEAAAATGVPGGGPVDSITVQRINIVEPDGTLRLVLTNFAQRPELSRAARGPRTTSGAA